MKDNTSPFNICVVLIAVAIVLAYYCGTFVKTYADNSESTILNEAPRVSEQNNVTSVAIENNVFIENNVIVENTEFSEDSDVSKTTSYNLPEKPSDEEALENYRKEVSNRLAKVENGGNYFSEEERKVYTENNVNIGPTMVSIIKNTFVKDYYYPLLYKTENGIYICYTNLNGVIYMEILQTDYTRGDYIGRAHSDELSKAIREGTSYAAIFDPETGSVSFWQFGKLVEEYTLPIGAVYTGYSYTEGYIFRAGSDVYALKDSTLQVIAHNVKSVVTTRYIAGSEDTSQPVFLMEDGSLKAYCSYDVGKTLRVDDEKRLKDFKEGGY